MAKRAVASFGELMQRLARDAIRIQQRLDAAHADEWRRFERVVAAVGHEVPEVARALAPSRLRVHRFELACRVRLEVDRRHGYEIKAMPLNVGYDVRYGTTAADESRVRLEVVQVPLGDAGPAHGASQAKA